MQFLLYYLSSSNRKAWKTQAWPLWCLWVLHQLSYQANWELHQHRRAQGSNPIEAFLPLSSMAKLQRPLTLKELFYNIRGMLPNVTTDRCGTKPTVIVKKPKVTCLRTYHGELTVLGGKCFTGRLKPRITEICLDFMVS